MKNNPFLANICIELGGKISENIENADIIFGHLEKSSKYFKNQMHSLVPNPVKYLLGFIRNNIWRILEEKRKNKSK